MHATLVSLQSFDGDSSDATFVGSVVLRVFFTVGLVPPYCSRLAPTVIHDGQIGDCMFQRRGNLRIQVFNPREHQGLAKCGVCGVVWSGTRKSADTSDHVTCSQVPQQQHPA